MAEFVSVAIDATLLTLVLALAAFGLAIIFGLVGVINMGHGAMLTLGAYFAWWGVSVLGLPFPLAVLLATLGVALVGLALEHWIIRHFYDRPFDTLLLTWAFFIVSTEVIKLVFGPDFRNIANPMSGAIEFSGLSFPTYRSLVAVISLGVIALTALIIFRTTYGIRIRALVQNREVSSLLGLNVAFTYKAVFCLGSGMAGMAGALIAPMMSIDPYIGNVFLVRSFFVVIVGGIGHLLGGTLLGSFLIGGSETLFALFSDQVVAQTIVFLLAIVVLRFRPQGVLSVK
ncbi:MAG: branched-chain amino acid ABC transporter permease [Halomonas sp.]|uniref:branched-chain amino acid ABC transporter permease n=1 Tax=Halomonas sp. TaxID=1486246 RepID=UPI00286FD3E8|nr:branched-chain amino acid ABC transporter permease [Halomonas sp.]MDR9439181.1 branched-chain amino acid ABC transporter permease [Halomonas sp.]